MDRMSTYENSIYYTVSRHDIAAVWVAFFSRCQRYCCRQAGDANRPGELTRDSTLAGSVAAAPKATATALPVVSRTSIARLLLRDWLRLRRSYTIS